MIYIRFLLGLIIFFIAFGCFSVGAQETNLLATSPLNANLSYYAFARKYILGPSDIISISVVDSPEYDQNNLQIQPDGNIVLGPVGLLHVAGMTVDQLHDALVPAYKRYLNDPQITVRLEHTKPFTVYVSGGVLKPGSYELVTDVTTAVPASSQVTPGIFSFRRSPLLSNVIVAAGGITMDADVEHVRISNALDNSNIEVNLLKIISEGDSNQDIYLMPGDSIMIPKVSPQVALSEARYNRFRGSTIFQNTIPVKVYGYVNHPGLVNLDSAQSANLNSAITAAGGYLTDSAYAPHTVYINRMGASGKLETIKVNPSRVDTTLMPNDIVYVPEKLRPEIGKAFDYTARLISPFALLGAGINNWLLIFDPKRYLLNVAP